jgi:hypothetical protein
MRKQIAPSAKAYLIRGGFYLFLLVSVSTIPFALGQWQARGHRTLRFAERVAYQRAIEEVYWRHRIWPKERPDSKPSLDAVMPQWEVEKKVTDYLRKSQALQDCWQRPITAKQLQAEMDRMSKHTKQPEVLRELFEALGNDPFVIAECLARPALAERLLTNGYSDDQRIHGELKQRAEADLRAHPTIEQMKQLTGKYSEIELVKGDSSHDAVSPSTEHGVNISSGMWDETVQRLTALFGNRPLETAPKAFETANGAPIIQIRNWSIGRVARRRHPLLRDSGTRERGRPTEARNGYVAQGAITILASKSREDTAHNPDRHQRLVRRQHLAQHQDLHVHRDHAPVRRLALNSS